MVEYTADKIQEMTEEAIRLNGCSREDYQKINELEILIRKLEEAHENSWDAFEDILQEIYDLSQDIEVATDADAARLTHINEYCEEIEELEGIDLV